MCPYALRSEKEIMICEPRQERCTLCVMGNMKTYKEIEREKGRDIENGRRMQSLQ